MDESDNDPDLLLRYLMTALITAEKGVEEAFNPLILDNHPLKPDDVIPLIIHTLNTFQEDIYIVMDDFHLISNDVVHSAIIRFLNYLPTKVHVIILSRHKLPQLYSRIRFHNDTVEITPKDLRLSDKEANDFFKVTIPLELTNQQIRELQKITGGWVTGFQIFGLSKNNKKTPNQRKKLLKIVGRESIDYLINEVVAMQSERVKSFLSQTAVLYRFNSDLCQHVTGDPDSQKIINDLYHQNIFLIPLDSGHAWYRYHHLFSEAIREWTKIASPGLIEEARKKAARWCAENAYTEEAFQYAIASGDFEFLADLMEIYLKPHILKAEISSSLRWLSKIPREVYLKRPILRLFECAIWDFQNRINDVSRVLPEIENQLSQVLNEKVIPSIEDYRDNLTFIKLSLDCKQNMYNIDIPKANSKIKQISKRNKSLAGYNKAMITVKAYIYRGDLPVAEKELDSVLPDILISENPSYIFLPMSTMSIIQRLQGRLKQSEETLLNAFDILNKENLNDTPIRYSLYFAMAKILHLRNELDESLKYILPLVRYLEANELWANILEGYSLLATIYMAKGDLKKAMHIAQKSKSISERLDYPVVVDETDELLFALSVHQGKTDTIESVITRGKPDLTSPFSVNIIKNASLYLFSLLLIGEFPKSRQILEELRSKCLKRNMIEIVLRIDIILSGICFFMNDMDQASKIMEHCIRFSEKEGYIRPFADNAKLILPLLNHLSESSKPISQFDHLKILLNTCESINIYKIETFKNPFKNNPFDLTKRELEILGYISDGYRNEQISDLAFISMSTVKTHIHHILKKLNAQNRTQAAMKAKEFLY